MVSKKQNIRYFVKDKKILLATAFFLLLGIAISLGFFDHNSPSATSSTKKIRTNSNGNAASFSTKGQKPNSSPENQNTSQSSTSPLVVPSGNFVSDHHPNLSGSPAPNSMTSVCNTSPGATCLIRFSMGNLTKALPPQITNSNGTTYWYWTLQNVGLTQGTWTVEALSSLNGQTKTAFDAMNLVVSP